MRLKINFIYIKAPTARQEGGRGPAAPQPGSRVSIYKLWNRKYIFVKNDFEKYKNKKNAQEGYLGKARETLYTMGGAEEPDNKMGHIHGFRPNVVNYWDFGFF